MFLSVIIPTRNNATLLKQALISLTRQSLAASEFEVLVVDNGSTDDTSQTVASFKEKLERLRYFFEPEPGLHIGRHKGMSEASAEILVYADDDIEAQPAWLETIQDCFSCSDVAMVGGNNLPNYLLTPPVWLTKLWNSGRLLGGNAIALLSIMKLPQGRYEISPYYVWGCNFSVRKHVLYEAGGFHPDGMPKELLRFRGDGETYVAQYLTDKKYRCIFDSSASIHHTVTAERMSKAYLEAQAFKQGISNSYTDLRLGSLANSRSINYLNRINFLKRMKFHFQLNAKRLIGHDRELVDLERMIQRGYWAGYNYHQNIYIDDPEVRGWVHREYYF